MHPLSRRSFLAAGAAATLVGTTRVGPVYAVRLDAADAPRRKMTIDLVCGMLGVAADQRQAFDFAKKHKFESVAPDAGFLGALDDGALEKLQADMRSAKIVFGAAGLGVDFRRDEAVFQDGMKSLPQAAKALARAGVSRVGTWLRPTHEELTYLANFEQHGRRLREVAKVLKDHGLRFGLEYVGPKTSWTAGRHAFVHTMAETKELIAEIGMDNVGFVLDSWHWYTAGESEADLLSLANKDIVACDLNDAPAGLAIDRQMDLSRELPAATGVIDLKTFLNALVKMDYDGPVRAEPFNAKLRQMPADEAVASTAHAMKKAFALVE